MLRILGCLAVAAALFAAFAANAGEPADAEGPDPRIGEEVRSICFGRNINGWKSLKGVDGVVLLEKGVNDWYYVEVSGGCRARTFNFATAIGIESRPAGGCVTQGDVIIVRDTANFNRRCFIKKIYEWDGDAQAPADDEDASDAADKTDS